MGLGQVTEIADVDLYKLVRVVLGPSKEGATGNTLQRGIHLMAILGTGTVFWALSPQA